jgi:hypothetical protein
MPQRGTLRANTNRAEEPRMVIADRLKALRERKTCPRAICPLRDSSRALRAKIGISFLTAASQSGASASPRPSYNVPGMARLYHLCYRDDDQVILPRAHRRRRNGQDDSGSGRQSISVYDPCKVGQAYRVADGLDRGFVARTHQHERPAAVKRRSF